MKHGITAVALSLVVPVGMAANPASTAYVNKRLAQVSASLGAEIDSSVANSPAALHPVGSCYGGGVVFYVNPDRNAPPGKRGLIAAPTDANGTSGSTSISGCQVYNGNFICAWDTTNDTTVTYSSANPSLYFTGNQNTTDILNTSTTGTWSAAAAVQYYNSTINPPPVPCEGCTPWYLPSHYELNTLYLVAPPTTNPSFWTNCDGTPPNGLFYWSSTQNGSTNAWEVIFDDTYNSPPTQGYVVFTSTSSQFGVRAIRAF